MLIQVTLRYFPETRTAGDQNGIQSAAIEPVPREMSLPVTKGMNFTDSVLYCSLPPVCRDGEGGCGCG